MLNAMNHASRIIVVPGSKADNVIASFVVDLIGDKGVSQF